MAPKFTFERALSLLRKNELREKLTSWLLILMTKIEGFVVATKKEGNGEEKKWEKTEESMWQ